MQCAGIGLVESNTLHPPVISAQGQEHLPGHEKPKLVQCANAANINGRQIHGKLHGWYGPSVSVLQSIGC